MVTHVHNFSTWKAEAGRLRAQVYLYETLKRQKRKGPQLASALLVCYEPQTIICEIAVIAYSSGACISSANTAGTLVQVYKVIKKLYF